jgi:hypothetical protein
MMSSTNRVKYIDNGIGRIKNNLLTIDNSFTHVGFPKEEEEADGPAGSMTEVAQIAVYNEYGTKDIPARPFMSLAYKTNVDGLKRLQAQMYKRVLRNEITVKQGLAIIGEWLSAKMKRTIDSVSTPPNAPSTIKQKNAALMRRTSAKALEKTPSIGTTAHPLINTAQMRNSITHVEVINEPPR